MQPRHKLVPAPTTGRQTQLRICLLFAAVWLSACSYVGLTRDMDEMAELALVAGPVAAPDGVADGVVVALFEDTGGEFELVHVDQLDRVVNQYVFIIKASTPYLLAGFRDSDGDLAYDPGEPLGLLGEERRLVLAPLTRLRGQGIRLDRATRLPAGLELDLGTADPAALESVPIAGGELTSLEDPRFEPERGEDGMWQPLTTVRRAGGGIYFLEPYDPERVPVLFVHGIGGTPRDFRYLIENLDRSRFQPWVFHYPSGMRLERAARTLARLVDSLQREHGFEHLVWTAHSMGGLVSRSALLQLAEDGKNLDFVDVFVTFSTPWNGHAAAAVGVRFMPTVVPAWLDMQPDSDFLRSVRAPLPAGLPHHLFFGYDTGSSVVMLYSHDTVVSLKTQLAPWAQEEAARSYGFNLDHMTILGDGAAAERFFDLLDGSWSRGRRSG